jgi:hypothetical protein
MGSHLGEKMGQHGIFNEALQAESCGMKGNWRICVSSNGMQLIRDA